MIVACYRPLPLSACMVYFDLVSILFGTSIPTSFNILVKMFLHLYNEGVERELVDEVYSSGGRTLHTICSQPLSRPAKMPCQHVAINDEG